MELLSVRGHFYGVSNPNRTECKGYLIKADVYLNFECEIAADGEGKLARQRNKTRSGPNIPAVGYWKGVILRDLTGDLWPPGGLLWIFSPL